MGKSNSDEDTNIYNFLINKIDLEHVIQKTDLQKFLDIVGSHVNLSGLEVETANDSRQGICSLRNFIRLANKQGHC